MRRMLENGRSLLAVSTVLCLCAGSVGAAQDFHLPGTQPLGSPDPPGSEIQDLFIPPSGDSPFSCGDCHQDPSQPAFPWNPWGGSMMALAARDPLFYAQLDLTNRDGLDRPEVAGMADLCLRCHSPSGWMEGRSADLSGMGLLQKDMFGVDCHVCHRLVDPLLPSKDPGHADVANFLNAFLPVPGLPPTYGNGMYVVDPKHVRRGPYFLADLSDHTASVVGEGLAWNAASPQFHPVMGSAFHKEGNLCGTCHDVSNPTDCGAATNADVQDCFPIERTWSEWRHSSFYDPTLPGGGEAKNCQSCHMSGPLNGVSFGGPCVGVDPQAHFDAIHHHDFTGGNAYVPTLIASMKARYETPTATLCAVAPDPAACTAAENNFKAAIEGLYPPATGSPFVGVFAADLAASAERARNNLRRSAFLDVVGSTPAAMTVRVTNRTGHKLPTGYPEGRRMWLNARFLAADGTLVAESGRYDAAAGALYHDQDLDGAGLALVGAPGEGYDVVQYTNASVQTTGAGRPTKVWEARLEFDPGGPGAHKEFHFALNNALLMDNRIPPEGWDWTGFSDSRALPFIPATYAAMGWQGDYGASGPAGPHLHFDEFAYPLPAGVDRAELTLHYQTTSREYVETLASDNPAMLVAGGYTRGSLLLEAWQKTGKSPPEVLARRVHALADADGDLLSDGWEAAHGLTGAPDGGFNDDPDGDGLSNWLEFQGGSLPVGVGAGDDPVVGGVRDAIDIVLVLDRSGSMNDVAPGTSTPKVDVLRDAVMLFLATWREYAVPGDRIGVVTFDTNAQALGAPPVLDAFVTEIGAIETSITALTASGWTAMGAGLHTALEALAGGTNPDHVILFSNGMQNRSPMVVPDAGGNLVIRDQTSAVNPDVTGNSNVVIGGSDYPLPAGVKAHTIGIGVAGTNSSGVGWHKLLADLAQDTGGKHNFITDAYELEGVFLEDLVESLKGNTLEYVAEARMDLASGETEALEFPVNRSAERFSTVVSWSGSRAKAPGLRLIRPDGEEEDLSRLTRGGPSHVIVSRYLTDPDAAPQDYGTWRLEVTGSERQPVRFGAHALIDDAALEYRFQVPGPRVRGGTAPRVAVMVSESSRLLTRLDARVTLEAPDEWIGALLMRKDAPDPPPGIDPDAAATPFARKLAGFATLEDAASRLGTSSRELALRDDGTGGDVRAGNGVFEALLPELVVPGHYRLRFRIASTGALGDAFVREEERSIFVGIGPIDVEDSGLHRVATNGATSLTFRPRDRMANPLGPGFAGHLVALAGSTPLVLTDDLDGSYSASLPAGFGADDAVRLILDGETFYDGPVPEKAGGRGTLLLWLLLILIVVILLVLLLRRR